VSRYLLTIAATALTGAMLAGSPAGATAAQAAPTAGGTWGTAAELPGSAALNTGGSATIASVSCSSPGDCSAGGYYTDSSHRMQALVDSQT
jgi:hypothetical protein